MDHPKFPVAVHILMRRSDQVLLLRRANTGFEDGRLSVVAGHVEPGETVRQAAIREAREEVGLTLAQNRLRVIGVMHRLSQEERIDFFLDCPLRDEQPQNCEPEKCAQLVWADRHDLPPDTIPYVARAIGRLGEDLWFEEYGWEHGAPTCDAGLTSISS